jgi:RNA recognition motif-containing protein
MEFRVNIFVGNLSYDLTEAELRAAFEAHGQVTSASIIMDRMTGRSKGFGFVEMADKAQGEAAIAALHLQELKGRALTVNEARPKTERPSGGGGYGGGYGGGGGRGGGRGGRDRY